MKKDQRPPPISDQHAGNPTANYSPNTVAAKNLRGRIHEKNDVMLGVGGNEQLGNLLRHYNSPGYLYNA